MFSVQNVSTVRKEVKDTLIHHLPSLHPHFELAEEVKQKKKDKLVLPLPTLGVLLRIQCRYRRLRVQSAAADPLPARQTHTVLVISGTTAEPDD